MEDTPRQHDLIDKTKTKAEESKLLTSAEGIAFNLRMKGKEKRSKSRPSLGIVEKQHDLIRKVTANEVLLPKDIQEAIRVIETIVDRRRQHDLRMKVMPNEFLVLLPDEIAEVIIEAIYIEEYDLRMKDMEKEFIALLPDEIAEGIIEVIDRIEDRRRQYNLMIRMKNIRGRPELRAVVQLRELWDLELELQRVPEPVGMRHLQELRELELQLLREIQEPQILLELRYLRDKQEWQEFRELQDRQKWWELKEVRKLREVWKVQDQQSLRERRERREQWEWWIRRNWNLLQQLKVEQEFKELAVLSIRKKLVIKLLQSGAYIAEVINSMERMLKVFKLLLYLIESGDDISQGIERIRVELKKFKVLTFEISLCLFESEAINIMGEELEEIEHFNSGDDYISEETYRLVKKCKDFEPRFSHDIELLESGACIVEETFSIGAEEAIKTIGKKIKEFVALLSDATERMGKKLKEFIAPLLNDIKLLSINIEPRKEGEFRHLFDMLKREEESSHGLESGSSKAMGVEEESHDLKRGPEQESYILDSGYSKDESHGLESGSSKAMGVEEKSHVLKRGPEQESYSIESGYSKAESHGPESGLCIEGSHEEESGSGIEEGSQNEESGPSIHEQNNRRWEILMQEQNSGRWEIQRSVLDLQRFQYKNKTVEEGGPSSSPIQEQNNGRRWEIPIQEQNNGRWEIQRSIVLGGLIESITSLAILTSAVNANISDENIITLALANLITGLFIVRHNLSGVEKRHTRAGLEKSHCMKVLREKLHYFIHLIIAFLSFLFSGLVAPLVYAFSFHKNRNKNLKIIAAAGASFTCTAILAIQKAHIQKPKNWLVYFKTASIYVSIGVVAFGLSYLAGYIFGQLLDELSWVH